MSETHFHSHVTLTLSVSADEKKVVIVGDSNNKFASVDKKGNVKIYKNNRRPAYISFEVDQQSRNDGWEISELAFCDAHSNFGGGRDPVKPALTDDEVSDFTASKDGQPYERIDQDTGYVLKKDSGKTANEIKIKDLNDNQEKIYYRVRMKKKEGGQIAHDPSIENTGEVPP